jgi:anti-anti-sigma regulatory factor
LLPQANLKPGENPMNISSLGNNAFLVELPAKITDPDEKPFLDATVPKEVGKKGCLILDFNNLQLVTGLGAYVFVKLAVLAGHRGQCLSAFGVSSHYRDVLKLTGLEQVIKVYKNKEEAFAAAGVSAPEQPSIQAPQNPCMDMLHWANPVDRLSVPEMPPRAINRNVHGLRAVGPVNGFGRLWQKTYRLPVNKPGLTRKEVVLALRQNLPAFQPPYNRFYPSKAGILRGEIIAIDSSTPGGPVSTGVLVSYSDDVCFTLMTPQGHPESGWVTFNAVESEGKITAQITGLARANDPVYEAAFRVVGSKMQVKIWTHVLASLAGYLGVPPDVTVEPRCIDKHVQWSQLGNVWYNAQVRTIFYMPFRKRVKSTNQDENDAK